MASERSVLQRVQQAGPLTWLLAAACVWALLLWLATLLGMGTRVGELAASASDPLPQPAPAARDRIGPLSQYAEAAARPLFTRDRRPRAFMAIGPGEGDGTQEAAPLDFILTGVMLTPKVNLAILQPSGGGNSQRVHVGSAPDGAVGWRLIDVQPRRAVFEGSGGQVTLELRTFGTDAKGGAPAAVPGAAPAQAVADAAEAELPPPTPDERRRIEEIRRRIEARRAQMQANGQNQTQSQNQNASRRPPSSALRPVKSN